MKLLEYKEIIKDRLPENSPVLHALLFEIETIEKDEFNRFCEEQRYNLKLISIVEALIAERKGAENCYCDINSGCLPCQPCAELQNKTNRALDEIN